MLRYGLSSFYNKGIIHSKYKYRPLISLISSSQAKFTTKDPNNNKNKKPIENLNIWSMIESLLDKISSFSKEGREKVGQLKLNTENIKKNILEIKKKAAPYFYYSLSLFLVFIAYKIYFKDQEKINYKEFKDIISRNLVSKIIISKTLEYSGFYYQAEIHLKNNEIKLLEIGNLDNFLQTLEKIQIAKEIPSINFVPVEIVLQLSWVQLFDKYHHYISGLVMVISLILFTKQFKQSEIMKSGQNVFGIGKSNAKVFEAEQNINVTFKDVAGLSEAKVEITEFVDFLKFPDKYKALGARLPRGALLSGPPGTGKTMLAKACAGEAKVPFLYMSGSDFVEMFVGVGASRVRDLFKTAKEKAPSIIFIDEIDAVGRKRESKMGGNDERDNTLNQLLVEMDGFGTDKSIIVLAATNKPDLLDSALTRPGRFDRTIEVGLPDLDGRREIFHVHLKKIKLDPAQTKDEFARRLATLTPGFSGADIANLCNEAAILAARKNKSFVQAIDFELASERILAGLEKKNFITIEEKKIVAVHESGHAVVSWFLEGGTPLLKITIIPRSKGSLGYAQYLPNESSLESKDELMDRICYILGGRCAEEIFFGKVTTGAYDDLQKCTEIAYILVSKLGMNENIGLRGMKVEDYLKNMSEETLKEIDFEVRKILREATERTKQIILEHKAHVEKLSEKVIEKETLDLKQIIEILGERPFKPKNNFKEYLETKKLIEKDENDKIAETKEKKLDAFLNSN